MNEFEEMSIPYISSLTSSRVQKLFILTLRIQEDLGLEDLKDLERVQELIISHCKIQQKERTWGHDYIHRLGRDLERDLEILKIVESKIKEEVKVKEFQEKTKENFEKCFGGKSNGSSSS